MIRSILFVCTANICRSPTAEGVFVKLLASRGAEGFQIDSAGTHNSHAGMPPFPMAVTAARRRGYDLTNHISRVLVPADFDHYDLILAMDRDNLAWMSRIVPTRVKHKIELFLAYGDAFHDQDVPDPYGGQERHFDQTLDRIEDGCRGLVELVARVR